MPTIDGLPLVTSILSTDEFPLYRASSSTPTSKIPSSTLFSTCGPYVNIGDLIYRGSGGTNIPLTIGSAGQVLTVSNTGIPAWVNPAAGFANPMTTDGDLIVATTGGSAIRLAVGSPNQVLTVSGANEPIWATPAAGFTNPMNSTGDLIVATTGGSPTRLGIGAPAQVLTTVGGTAAWANVPAGFSNPMNSVGDLIAGSTGGAAVRLAVGTTGQVLTTSGGNPVWATPAFVNPMNTLGDVITGGAAGAASRLGIGSVGQVLTVSAGGVPSWAASAAGFSNPMTTAGDLIVGTTGGAAIRLAVGAGGTVLTVQGGLPVWAAASASQNWPAVTQTVSNPLTSSDSSNTYLGALTITADALGSAVTPGFSNITGEQLTYNWTGGYNFENASVKTTTIPWQTTFNCRGMGQRAMFSNTMNVYGAGDAEVNSNYFNVWGGFIASGDEGQKYDRNIIGQGNTAFTQGTLPSGTISSVTTSTANTTTTQAITKSAAAQAVTVADLTGFTVGQWVEIDKTFPGNSVSGVSEVVKIQAKSAASGAGTFTATFWHNHNNGATVLGATRLILNTCGNFGEGRLIVNMSQPSYSTGTASIGITNSATPTITGVGTTWTTGMVGGDSLKIGAISFAADDVTSAPFGAGAARFRDWIIIQSVTNGTTILADQFPGYPSTGSANVAGAYEIRPAIRIEKFDGPTVDGSGANLNTNSIVVGNNSFTWTVGDTLYCNYGTDQILGGGGFSAYPVSQACALNQLHQVNNSGAATFQQGYRVQGTTSNGKPGFVNGMIIQPARYTNGLTFQGQCDNATLFLQNTNGTSKPHIKWRVNSTNAAGIYYNMTVGSNIEFQMEGEQQVTAGILNKGKLMATHDTNALSMLEWGGYIRPSNGIVNKTTTLVSVTTILNTDLFSTYLINGATFAVTLPAASGVPAGKEYFFKKIDAGAANAITAAGADTIDGAGTWSLTAQNKYVRIQSDGTSKWYVTGNN